MAAILDYVQHSFNYSTDQDQFGKEKYFFCEENFYYPKNDCEDRAILLSWLVRRLVGLDVVLLHYPNHLCTAVRFTTNEAHGDYLTIDGERSLAATVGSGEAAEDAQLLGDAFLIE